MFILKIVVTQVVTHCQHVSSGNMVVKGDGRTKLESLERPTFTLVSIKAPVARLFHYELEVLSSSTSKANRALGYVMEPPAITPIL